MEAFVPKVNKDHKYAVAVPTENKTMSMIQTYRTKEDLVRGLAEWKQIASSRQITQPYPIELLDPSGKCRIMTELLENSTN